MTNEERTAQLCKALHLISRSIADYESSVIVMPTLTASGRTIFQLNVDSRDRGYLIVRDGRVAEALRQYVRAYQLHHGGRYGFDVEGGMSRPAERTYLTTIH